MEESQLCQHKRSAVTLHNAVSNPFQNSSSHGVIRLPSAAMVNTSTATPSSSTVVSIQKRGLASKKHKRIIKMKMAKGFRGRSKNTFRAAIRRVEKGLQYAYRDRKVKKREFRKLWIERINAGVRQHGMSYSRFINAMNT